ncbi:Polysaccharide deacetylase [Chitinophaga sp. CF118]|uniref:polysaccharide deacetylase family protein n=1 Tax=Chitinophaga sp. CF118 TaxID=1884367 RepID=UPI0008E5D581|nr:polysaccharide deacetylase family protein [Chitinophaga sp. CF118]SFD80305.1 Polysaccharide deacetylase [Chitinophaga sp. CF118]
MNETKKDTLDYGNFIISLDFELLWGVRDCRTKEQYGKNVLGVHTVIPRLLETFREYKVRATFSTVGFLFFENKQELINNVPVSSPSYKKVNLSPYNDYFDLVGDNLKVDLYHYAPTLIKLIQDYPEQEIGTHTFSHYYCLEEGQNIDEFRTDIESAIKIGKKYGIALTSLVFPRNQFNDEYVKVCNELGIICYRGNEHSWLYVAKNKDNRVRRIFRLLDAYINISGHNSYTKSYLKSKYPIDIPASRFLRPYSRRLKLLDGLKLHRIKSGMSYAARNNMTYHLWWHPHNFGVNQNENFSFLKRILAHYNDLNKRYNFQSNTMSELANHIKNGKQENKTNQ